LEVTVANSPRKSVAEDQAQQHAEDNAAQDVEVEANDTHTHLTVAIMKWFPTNDLDKQAASQHSAARPRLIGLRPARRYFRTSGR
jgi:hypothetical protein